MNTRFNGFGDAAAIETERTALEATSGGKSQMLMYNKVATTATTVGIAAKIAYRTRRVV